MLFQKGMQKLGGRQKGVRNRLSHAFLTDLLEEWTEHGRETLKIARIERPVEFAKLVAGILPKEFELTTETSLSELTDQDIDRFIEYCRSRVAAGADAKLINGGEEPQAEREPVTLLPPVLETAKVS